MKKAFHAPDLPDVKPPRAPIEGRPRGTVPTIRIKDPIEKRITWPKFVRMVRRSHAAFFEQRPWVKTSDL